MKNDNVMQFGQGNSYPLMSGWPYFTSAMPNPWFGQYPGNSIVPRVDVIETDSAVIYAFELPGADGKQLNLEISDTEVALNAPMSHPKKHIKSTYVYQERPKGSYIRLLKPPLGVNLEEAKANYENGILEVTFPKTQQKT